MERRFWFHGSSVVILAHYAVMKKKKRVFCPVLCPLSCSKLSLGSHEYVQNCRKWENEISLQLLSQSTMRRDLARTVSPT